MMREDLWKKMITKYQANEQGDMIIQTSLNLAI